MKIFDTKMLKNYIYDVSSAAFQSRSWLDVD